MAVATAWGGFVLAATDGAMAGEIEDHAAKFVDGLADKAINALTVPNISTTERSNRFRVLLNENFAVKTIARWVLGRHWNKATEGQQEEYMRLFEDLLVVTYVDRFAKYSGEQLKISKTQTAGDKDIVVYSDIMRNDGGKPLDVAWRLRTKDGSFKIVDVMVEGVSMGQTQRSEFASVIRQNGGKIEGLLAELRKRIDKSA